MRNWLKKLKRKKRILRPRRKYNLIPTEGFHRLPTNRPERSYRNASGM